MICTLYNTCYVIKYNTNCYLIKHIIYYVIKHMMLCYITDGYVI